GVHDVRLPGVHGQRSDIVLRVATGPDSSPGLPTIGAPPDPRPDRADTDSNVLTHNHPSPPSDFQLGAMTATKRVRPKEAPISDEKHCSSVSEHRQEPHQASPFNFSNGGSTRRALLAETPPMVAEALPLPGDDGARLDKREGGLPAGPWA